MVSSAKVASGKAVGQGANPAGITVLLVDDDQTFARSARTLLEASDDAITVNVVQDASTALQRLEQGHVDCVVSDYAMPGTDGLELCRRIKDERPGLPFILLTGNGDEETASRAFDTGADDYLCKACDPETFRDLARRIRLHVQRSGANRLYQEAWQHATVALSIHDAETGRLLDLNDRFSEMLGVPQEAALPGGAGAATLRDVPATIDRIKERIQASVGERPETFEWLDESPTVDRLWVQVVLERAHIDGREVVLASVRDLTERRDREETIRAMYDTIADPRLGFEEKVDDLMSLGRRVLGLGFATLSHLEGDDYVFEHVQSPSGEIQPGTTVSLEETLCEQAVLSKARLVVDEPLEAQDLTKEAALQLSCYVGAPVTVEGEVHGTFCFYDIEPRGRGFSEWEITLVDLMSRWISVELEKKRVREELERENERLEDFASMVSHDLRSPLSVAAGHAQLLRDEHAGESLDEILRALGRTRGIIDDALTWARTGAAVEATEPVLLSRVAEASWGLVDHQDARIESEAELVIHADEPRLRRLLENLFRNALDHGGRDVTVTIGTLDHGFFVEDDGPGLPEADHEKIFQAGYSTASKGTGFGLAIVQQIVDAHGWTVHATRGPSGGARFEIHDVETESRQGCA